MFYRRTQDPVVLADMCSDLPGGVKNSLAMVCEKRIDATIHDLVPLVTTLESSASYMKPGATCPEYTCQGAGA